jgi:AcrR family transcriptional regulator
MGKAARAIKPLNAAPAENNPATENSAPALRIRGGDSERRTAILDCAETVFLEHGFQGASMSAIAARLGGSKGTLYNYFAGKDDLFLACALRHCQSLHEQMSSLIAEGGDLIETLTRLGRRHLEFITSDDLVRRFRLIVAEAERAPDLVRTFYDTGPARGAEMIAAYLERAMEAGAVRRADPVRAAHHFIGLCSNRLWKARLCNSAPAPDAAAIEDDVGDAVRVFVAAYGAPPAA